MSKVMGKAKRHNSLIPLSREHHYGLLLCLRIRRGLEKQKEDQNWQRAKADDVVRFFDSDLVPHFRAEENVLFPTMRGLSAAPELIEELLSEHRKIERLVEQLRQTDCDQLADRLIEFADLLESHIRKEERDLFPVYESLIPPDIDNRVEEEIKNLIGPALQPKNPELLE